MKSTLSLIDRLCALCEGLLPMHMARSLLYDDNETTLFLNSIRFFIAVKITSPQFFQI